MTGDAEASCCSPMVALQFLGTSLASPLPPGFGGYLPVHLPQPSHPGVSGELPLAMPFTSCGTTEARLVSAQLAAAGGQCEELACFL